MSEHPETVAVNAYLARRWCGSKRMTAYIQRLWADYVKLDVADLGHFVSQLTNDNEEQFWQRLWELQLGSHLLRLGYNTKSPKHGPDFRFEVDGLSIWVEAVSPAPRDIPTEWFSFPSDAGTSYDTPNKEMLLRWTAAFRQKTEKLQDYALKGITAAGDACVIAVNGSQISGFFSDAYGISLLPWAVEVVFPVGAIQAVFTYGRDDVTMEREVRHEIANVNGSPVSLCPFTTPKYSGISALITCTTSCSPEMCLPLYIAHNPFAAVPIPLGFFGETAEEWQAKPVDEASGMFSLSRVR
jgi:hypothetical protein